MINVRSFLFLLVPCLVACGRKVSEDPHKECAHHLQKISFSPERPYASCDQILHDFQAYNNYDTCKQEFIAKARRGQGTVRAMSSSAKNAVADASSTRAESSILTNVRHSGVDEGDFVKVSTHQIFVTDINKINVLDRKSKKHLGVIELPEHSSNNEPLLLIEGNKLIVSKDRTLMVYELHQQQLPKLRQQKSFEREVVELRLLNEELVAVTQGQLNLSAQENLSQSLGLSPARCSNIYRSTQRPIPYSGYTHIERMPVADIYQASSIVFLGDHKLYMTDKNIYLYEQL